MCMCVCVYVSISAYVRVCAHVHEDSVHMFARTLVGSSGASMHEIVFRQMGHIVGNAISVPVMAGIMKGALDAMDM